MPLQFDTAFVPASAGMDQSVHERVLPVAGFREITNGEFDKHGEIVKRGAFEYISRNVASGGHIGTGGNVRGIYSTGKELVALGHRRLYAYNQSVGEWYDRGALSPWGGELVPRIRDERTMQNVDVIQKGSFVGYCCRTYQEQFFKLDQASDQTQLTWSLGVELIIYDTNDSRAGFYKATLDAVEVGPKTNVVSTDSAPFCPRMLSGGIDANEKLILAYQYGDAQDDAVDLKVRGYDATDPSDTADWLTIISDTYWGSSGSPLFSSIRRYDGIDAEYSSGGVGQFVMAWIEDDSGTRDIKVRTYRADTGAAVLSPRTLSTSNPYSLVALCKSQSGDDEVYVAAVGNSAGETGTPDIIEVWSLDVTDLTVNWGPVTIRNISSRFVSTLGIAHDGDNSQLMVTWQEYSFSPSDSEFCSRTLTDSGTPQLTELVQENLYLISRPFYFEGRPYALLGFDVTTNLAGISARYDAFGAYSAQIVVDLDPATSGTRAPRMAGLLAVGQTFPEPRAAAGVTDFHIGSANNAFQVSGENRVRMATQRIAEFIADEPVLPNPGTTPSFAGTADELILDFDALPTATRVGRNAFVIGGGYVSYYDGDYAHELGFARPPVMSMLAATPTHITPSVTTGDYVATAVFEHTRNGAVHRSGPGPFSGETVASGEALEFGIIPLPCSHRPDEEVNIVLYLSDPDQPIPYAARTQAYEVRPNDTTQETVDILYTEAREQGPPIYTMVGNDLANVSPSGALVVATAIERLFTGAHHSKDVVGFSDPYAPSTEAEDVVAPELNDAFVKLATDGQEVTMVQEMDDNVIIGTTESIYALTGEGPDLAGLNSDFPPLRRITTDRGCINRRSVVAMPDGIAFEADAGIYLLTRGFELEDIGDAMRDELESYPVITSATLVAKKQQIRFTCCTAAYDDAVILVYDYKRKLWTRFVVLDGSGSPFVPMGSCVHAGKFYVVDRSGNVRKQELEGETQFRDNYPQLSPDWVPLTIKGGWFQPKGPGSWERVAALMPMLRRVSSTLDLTYSLYADWSDTPTKGPITIPYEDLSNYVDAANRMQPDFSVTQQLCQAFSWELTDAEPSSGEGGNGAGYAYAGATVQFGFERGRAKLPQAQRS